jgi:hypothetical protein
MPADQPSAFNLEYLKKRSKRLLRECRAVDAEAIAWVQARLPRLRSLDGPALSTSIGLADVQHAVAVEHGFSSWGDLTRYGDPLSRLLTAIRGAHIVTLRRELRSFSGLTGANAFAAAALGDANVARVDGDEIVRAAVRGSIDEVRLMLTCGFPPDTVGESARRRFRRLRGMARFTWSSCCSHMAPRRPSGMTYTARQHSTGLITAAPTRTGPRRDASKRLA